MLGIFRRLAKLEHKVDQINLEKTLFELRSRVKPSGMHIVYERDYFHKHTIRLIEKENTIKVFVNYCLDDLLSEASDWISTFNLGYKAAAIASLESIPETKKTTKKENTKTCNVRNKVCYACKEKKPASEFNKSKKGTYGLHSYCKECNRKKSKEHNLKRKQTK